MKSLSITSRIAEPIIDPTAGIITLYPVGPEPAWRLSVDRDNIPDLIRALAEAIDEHDKQVNP